MERIDTDTLHLLFYDRPRDRQNALLPIYKKFYKAP